MTRTLALVTLLALTACKKEVAPPPAAKPMAVAPVAEAPLPLEEAIEQMMLNFERVHFGYDSSDLDSVSKAALEANVTLMKQHPKITVEIQGHADERGTVDYNLALGQRRAAAVRDYMTLTGVAKSRVTTISFGEEVPIDASSSEVAWSKNRRAEFRITAGTDGVVGTVQ